MNRKEAQITASAESEHYRPLSIGTISLLLPTGNSVLAMLMGGSNGAISANHEDLIVFLFVHHKQQKLSDIRALISKGKDALTNAAYDWVDNIDAMELAEGVDYYTDTQTRIDLLAVDNITETGKNTEKKTLHSPTR